jgi:hypothetical protein
MIVLSDHIVLLPNQESIHFVLAQKSRGLISNIVEFRHLKTDVVLASLCAIISYCFRTYRLLWHGPVWVSHLGPESYPGVDGSGSRLP